MTDDNNIINLKGFKDAEKITGFLKKLSFIPVLAIVVVLTIPTMWYTVDQDENAVILRFGKFNRIEPPGPHLKMPWGIETKSMVSVTSIRKLEFGYRTKEAGVRTTYEEKNYSKESFMLTGELNVLDVEWAVQYKVKNARDFLFNVRNVKQNIFDLSQSVMREVIGDHTATEAINSAREEIAAEVLKNMQKIADDYKMGITIVALTLQGVSPPEEVKPAIDGVNSAEQNAKQIANLAEQQRQKLREEEKGKAAQSINEAQAYKIDLTNRAQGDAQRFLSLYEEYRKAPDITKKRLYFDRIKDVLAKTEKLYVVDPAIKGIVPLLQLSGDKP